MIIRRQETENVRSQIEELNCRKQNYRNALKNIKLMKPGYKLQFCIIVYLVFCAKYCVIMYKTD